MPEKIAALLLLSDGRFPAGGYAHSGGLEESVNSGRVHDSETLESFLTGRAATTGAVAAAFAAASCRASHTEDTVRLRLIDTELDARIPSPTLRAVSRQLGRQLIRAMHTVHPHTYLVDLGRAPHQPVALGAAAAAMGLSPAQAALSALHETVTGPATAAVRVLSLDPLNTHAILARLSPFLDQLAEEAGALADTCPEVLPAAGSPLMDIGAERHAGREARLFAS